MSTGKKQKLVLFISFIVVFLNLPFCIKAEESLNETPLVIFEEFDEPLTEEISTEERYICLQDADEFFLYPNYKTQEDLSVFFTVPPPDHKLIDLNGTEKELTQKFIALYLTDTYRLWIAKCLENSAPYRYYIQQLLKEYNLPMALQYLPIIESNFTNGAVSSSGAVGMWQFMENSMNPFLKKNSWYDERKDPWLSTIAALKKLQDNYKTFGNWESALAAYNCGAGAMSRMLRSNPGKDFWYLAEKGILRKQTADYVPKLLAVAEIIENAEYYGAIEISIADKCMEVDTEDTFEYITTVSMLPLKDIASYSGVSESLLKFLNPALLRNCTPPAEKYNLRIPSGTLEAVQKAFEEHKIPQDAIIHTVAQGDSLWALSRKYGLTVQELCSINGIREESILSIGQKIVIPLF